ncbi:polyprenyl synthetase family protein [Mycolicibacterium sp. J2]|uniref:polyprenyl synthetase family protein n=1 Tax=Mycolicibacterium sp. J2 TaxID=2993511 RepID=UPI003A4D833E
MAEHRHPTLVDTRPDTPAGDSSCDWRASVRAQLRTELADFLSRHCTEQLRGAHVDIAADVLRTLTHGGKFVRSTFMYLGWTCGAAGWAPSAPAVRACASLELLHAFALLQDDVMDSAQLRRGHPAAHVAFSRWHRERGLSGESDRFGESAAVLLGDLCLVWAEQMLRTSGIDRDALSRVWPRYDMMRTELAVGQFADLVNDSCAMPSLDDVLDVLRRKSGNYTVRRPLELGAAMAGCGPGVVDALGDYGGAIGEAFQLRDDVLGVAGSVTETGKPTHTDLADRKATSVVVAAHLLAEPAVRRELTDLMTAPRLEPGDIDRWRTLIHASGALEWIENLIAERLRHALRCLDRPDIPHGARTALTDMATFCTERLA